VERQGVWSISPNGKVIHGSLFDLEKLEPKKKRTTVRLSDRSTSHGKKARPRP
jgi:hypothetical protein